MEIHDGGNLHYNDCNMLITPYDLTMCLLAIFKVTEVSILIFNLKYFIVGIVITLTSALPSTNIMSNNDPLHCTLMIGSHSCSTTMAFKDVSTFGALGVGTSKTLRTNNPFLNDVYLL